ncbi:hypothetical protein B0H13DRAFT_2576828, partial [Mycena leptocephala]
IANTVREYIGANGGVVAGAMSHGCSDCTHLKCYKSDLLAAGAALDDRADGVANDPSRHATADPRQPQEEIPGEPNLLYESRQEPPADGRRGYTRLAAMDGKTITHKVHCNVFLTVPSELDTPDLCGYHMPERSSQLQEWPVL